MSDLMSNKKISIYGSCVTRDVFTFMNKEEAVKHYLARTSLISQMAKPLPEQAIPDLSSISSDWQRRMIIKDFMKDGPPYENNMILLMDFVDERFNIVNFKDSLVTESAEFGNIKKRLSLKISYPFKRGSEADMSKWTHSCLSFRSVINRFNLVIVLHKAYFSNYYHNQESLFNPFPNQCYIDNTNARLRLYYEKFIDICLPKVIIEIPDDLRVGIESHKWGLAPFHYIPDYYTYLWRALQSVDYNSESI